MKFTEFDCSPAIAEKLRSKHQVALSEVQDVLDGLVLVRRGPSGFHYVYGRTMAGRYLFLVVLDLGHSRCEIKTARDMTAPEKRTYWRR